MHWKVLTIIFVEKALVLVAKVQVSHKQYADLILNLLLACDSTVYLQEIIQALHFTC